MPPPKPQDVHTDPMSWEQQGALVLHEVQRQAQNIHDLRDAVQALGLRLTEKVAGIETRIAEKMVEVERGFASKLVKVEVEMAKEQEHTGLNKSIAVLIGSGLVGVISTVAGGVVMWFLTKGH